MEEGESEQDALVRELDEELGVTVQPLRRLWCSVTPWNVELCWWLVQLPPGVQLQLNPAEVAEVHWLAADEMRELADLLESNRDFLAAVACGEICLDAPPLS